MFQVGDNTDLRQPEAYHYSSAAYYELNEDRWGFITHYEEHL